MFTVLERIKMVTLRNFIKRMHCAISQAPELQLSQKSAINLKLLLKPLLAWDNELDLDGLEFLIANLAGNGLINGCINRQHRALFLIG